MKKVIVALDVDNKDQALSLINELSPPVVFYKVGLELYASEGNRIVEEIKERNLNVFLDLKLHDIPNTVAKTVSAIAKLKPDMITVHTLGGEKMLEAAVDSAKSVHSDIKVLGVTVLTSLEESDFKEIGLKTDLREMVLDLAHRSYDSGCDGVVCSVNDLGKLKNSFPSLLKVTPGIRLPGDNVGDQKRISTPKNAIENGADYLVIGRSITENQHPNKALNQLFR